jgi:hypothetical protein
MRKRKLIGWDSLHLELLVPREFQKNRRIEGKAEDLMATFKYVLKMCLKDCKKVDPALKRFRIKVQ